MASITSKRVGRGLYYYMRECKRVNGKPKVVWQKYLGRAEDILAAVVGSRDAQPVPLSLIHISEPTRPY